MKGSSVKARTKSCICSPRHKSMCHVDQIKCIKDENDEMLAEAAHIKLRYQTYSLKLLKKEGDKDIMSE